MIVAASGAALWEALQHAMAMDVDLRVLIPNVILFVNSILVGYFMARTQLGRRPLLGGWSLSGVAMSGVFLTCAMSHLVAGLLTGSNPAGSSSTTSACRRPSPSCGRLPRQQGLRARLEPPPAGRSRRPARAPLTVG